jgi:hypothetical protein
MTIFIIMTIEELKHLRESEDRVEFNSPKGINQKLKR